MKLIIKVTPTEEPRHWELLETVWYKGIKVPSEFVFDGASIPLGLRWMFPHGGKKFFAACIHDYAYRTGCVTKEVADNLFYEAMIENEVTPWKAKAMYEGVNIAGRSSWDKHRRNDNVQA